MKISNYFAKEKMDDVTFIQTFIEKLDDLTDEDICWADSDLNEDNENKFSQIVIRENEFINRINKLLD